MSNQRDKDKVFVGFYIHKDHKKAVQALLKSVGSNLTEYFYTQVLKLIESKEDEIIKKLKEADGRTTQSRIKRAKKTKKGS